MGTLSGCSISTFSASHLVSAHLLPRHSPVPGAHLLGWGDRLHPAVGRRCLSSAPPQHPGSFPPPPTQSALTTACRSGLFSWRARVPGKCKSVFGEAGAFRVARWLRTSDKHFHIFKECSCECFCDSVTSGAPYAHARPGRQPQKHKRLHQGERRIESCRPNAGVAQSPGWGGRGGARRSSCVPSAGPGRQAVQLGYRLVRSAPLSLRAGEDRATKFFSSFFKN